MKPPMWWSFTDVYWVLPFYAEMGYPPAMPDDRDNHLAGREQLWAEREGLA